MKTVYKYDQIFLTSPYLHFEYVVQKMKLEDEIRSVSERNLDEIRLENTPFTYKAHHNTYYIPVYPRAFIEEVTNIDYDRRTVTAKFVLMITVCLKVDNPNLQKFLKDHLILEFGYNQVLFIPEHITLENSPFLISQDPTNNNDYVNYRISGAIECSAEFDSMFFPYRRIEVTNHLCIRQQEYREWNRDGTCNEYHIRYNIMMLVEQNHEKYAQFLHYTGDKLFGDFKIDNNSSQAVADTDHTSIKQSLNVPQVLQKIYQMVQTKDKMIVSRSGPRKSLISTIVNMANGTKGPNEDSESHMDERIEELIFEQEEAELRPFQHIGLRFTMSSLSIGFVWQHEVPLWILSIVTLFLFEAQPNIGNKFSNIILLLVSYISIISSFRQNNVAQQTLTCYQAKLMALTLVPILLIITTAIDYYNMDLFNGRIDQVYNPFAIASIAIVLTCQFLSLGFLLYLWITKFVKFAWEDKPKAVKGDEVIDWVNMVELEWGHQKLESRLKDIVKKSKDRDVFSFHHPVLRQDSRDSQTIDIAGLVLMEVAVKRKGLTVADS